MKYGLIQVYNGGSVMQTKKTPSSKPTTPITTIQNEEVETKKKSKIPKIVGIVSAVASFANSAVGSYTGNKVRQANNQTLITVSSMLALAPFKPMATTVASIALITKKTIDLEIREANSLQQSRYRQSNLGKMTTSGSRWSGGR